MPFTYFNGYDTTPANNSSNAPDGAPEGMPAGDVNDAIRQLMSATAESHDSYVALIANDPGADPAAPTALPAAAWTYEYADAAQIDVDNAWSVVQNFAPGASAGALNSDNIGLEVRGQTIAQITFNTAGDAGVMQYSEASNISGSGPGEILVDSPFVGGIGYFTSLHSVGGVSGANVTATGPAPNGKVTGRIGSFTADNPGETAVDVVVGDVIAKEGNIATNEGNLVALSADAGVDGLGQVIARVLDIGDGDSDIAGNLQVHGTITDTNDAAILTGGANGNYPAETPVQFTTTAVMPGDSGKMLDPLGATSITGTPVAGNRLDIFNNTGGDVNILASNNFKGFGGQLGTTLTIPDEFGATIIFSGTVWYTIGAGSIA